MRQEVSRRLTVLAKDGQSPGENWTKSWRKSRLTVLATVRANSPGETKNSLFIRSAYKNSICFSFYECFMACISSQIKSNGYQNYFDIIIFSKTSFLHAWVKTTELQKGLIHFIKGHKKTPRSKSITSPPRLVRFLTWCLLQT